MKSVRQLAMTNIDATRVFLAGSQWADLHSKTGLAPMFERLERLKQSALVLVWVEEDGHIDERALIDVCLAASHGVPYGVATANGGLYRNENLHVFNHGARLVLTGLDTVDEALSFAATCVHHNPKGDRIWPFDAGDIVALLGRCESPIEERLAIHLATAIGPEASVVGQHVVAVEGATYRLDFAVIESDGMRIAVECDGHDFHERTKEQAARDKSRDRALQAAGWRVLRFTGSEIWADPRKCAGEVHRMVLDGMRQEE